MTMSGANHKYAKLLPHRAVSCMRQYTAFSA